MERSDRAPASRIENEYRDRNPAILATLIFESIFNQLLVRRLFTMLVTLLVHS